MDKPIMRAVCLLSLMMGVSVIGCGGNGHHRDPDPGPDTVIIHDADPGPDHGGRHSPSPGRDIGPDPGVDGHRD